jgi:hypothetical protein
MSSGENMYQILAVQPGTIVLPGVKHGDKVTVSCGIDNKFHNSVTLVISELGQERPERGDDELYGWKGPLDDYVTFSYKQNMHWSCDGKAPVGNPPKPDIVIGTEWHGTPIFFTGVTASCLYCGDEV